MISAIRVGRDTKFFASHRKSSKKLYSVGERRSQFLDSSSCRKASQRMGNKPVQPEIANDMDLSSPITLCHSFVAIERCVWGIESSISCSQVPWCFGRHIVLLMVSMSQLRMILLVVHHGSPLLSFLMDAGIDKTLCHHRQGV